MLGLFRAESHAFPGGSGEGVEGDRGWFSVERLDTMDRRDADEF